MTAKTEYRDLVQACADQGRILQRHWSARGAPQTLYLYCRPSEPGKPGALILAREDAPGAHLYELVHPQGLRSNVPYEQYFQWIYERAKDAPVLPIEPAP